jgi:AcrR family transcriptional regulator
MSAQTEPKPAARARLSRERVLRAAIALADEGGIEALTMRRLAEKLGAEAMSLYYHVTNKEALLDGVVDVILGEINEVVSAIHGPSAEDDWKTAMRKRILAAREVLLRHPWAPAVIESRITVSPAAMRYFDDLLGLFRQGGFSYDLAHHAMHALGSRALGFTQELFEPDDQEAGDEEVTGMLEQMADEFPHIVGMVAEVSHNDPDSTLGWCDDQFEFEFALDLILNGLKALRQTEMMKNAPQ